MQIALETNRQRFLERNLFDEAGDMKASGLKNNIKKLKDGESVVIEDYWDVDINKTDLLGYYYLVDTDFYQALGSVKMRSTGKFSIKRKGDIFYIVGNVTHAMEDIYNFNEEFLDKRVFKEERLIAQSGLAKPFKVHWEMKQNVKGIVTQRNSHLYWDGVHE